MLKEKAQRRDGGNWRLVAFTLKLCSRLSLLIFTVNVIGLSITLETQLRACLWGCFLDSLAEERKTQLD